MSHELFYTSSPTGLKPGTKGFCTVAMTNGLSAQWVDVLEGLSGYRYAFEPGSAHAHLNPVQWAHWRVTVGGKQRSVLSRVTPAGSDYTGRSNKFAHHVLLEPAEQIAAGPAALLRQPSLMERQWEGEPRMLPTGRAVPALRSPEPRICEAWKRATGDAGWAGVAADSFVSAPSKPVVILCRPDTDVLALFEEALALLPEKQRWQVTFNTYFTDLPGGLTCHWRGLLADSAAGREAARQVGRYCLIDATTPKALADSSMMIEVARHGRAAKVATAAPASHEEEVFELENSPEASDTSRPESAKRRLLVNRLNAPLKPRTAEAVREPDPWTEVIASSQTTVQLNSQTKGSKKLWVGLAIAACILLVGGGFAGSRMTSRWKIPQAPIPLAEDQPTASAAPVDNTHDQQVTTPATTNPGTNPASTKPEQSRDANAATTTTQSAPAINPKAYLTATGPVMGIPAVQLRQTDQNIKTETVSSSHELPAASLMGRVTPTLELATPSATSGDHSSEKAEISRDKTAISFDNHFFEVTTFGLKLPPSWTAKGKAYELKVAETLNLQSPVIITAQVHGDTVDFDELLNGNWATAKWADGRISIKRRTIKGLAPEYLDAALAQITLTLNPANGKGHSFSLSDFHPIQPIQIDLLTAEQGIPLPGLPACALSLEAKRNSGWEISSTGGWTKKGSSASGSSIFFKIVDVTFGEKETPYYRPFQILFTLEDSTAARRGERPIDIKTKDFHANFEALAGQLKAEADNSKTAADNAQTALGDVYKKYPNFSKPFSAENQTRLTELSDPKKKLQSSDQALKDSLTELKQKSEAKATANDIWETARHRQANFLSGPGSLTLSVSNTPLAVLNLALPAKYSEAKQ